MKVRYVREFLALKKVYYQEMQENEEFIKMKFLGELISGKMSLADALEKGKRFHMNLGGPFYRIILFKFIQEDHVKAGQSEDLARAYAAIGNYVERCVPFSERRRRMGFSSDVRRGGYGSADRAFY